MEEDNFAYYTLNNGFTSIPVKQKVYIFQSPVSQVYRKIHNPQHVKHSETFTHIKNKESINPNWRPKLPTKKLFDDPKFFISMERRKIRILSGLRNASQFHEKTDIEKPMKGNKIKSRTLGMRKASSNVQRSFIHSPQHHQRVGWDSNQSKTPYLNFNMQYLIKKRKLMNSPSIQQSPKSRTMSTLRFNEQLKYR